MLRALSRTSFSTFRVCKQFSRNKSCSIFGNTAPFEQIRKGELTEEQISRLPSTPAISPSYPKGPYRFINREFFIVSYETDPIALRSFVPYPLVPNTGNQVLFEWIAMPDSSGFGNYQESGIVIPCTFEGKDINFVAAMLLDCEPPIACGREIWGFPKKRANPILQVKNDTLVGTLEYAGQRVATGTMAYKYDQIPLDVAKKSLEKRTCLLKIIPDPETARPTVAQLIEYHLEDVNVLSAWSGPARLHLQHSAAAPLADLPIQRVLGGKHILANLTLPYGNVLYDYHAQSPPERPKEHSIIVPDFIVPNEQPGEFTYEKVMSTSSMPAYAPSFPERGPALNAQEALVIVFETDPEVILPYLPEDLALTSDRLILQISNVEATGVGSYSRAQVHAPVRIRRPDGSVSEQEYLYSILCIVDCSNTITFGRERFGKPYKYGFPKLSVQKDTLACSVFYGEQEVLRGSMMYKHSRKPSSFSDAMKILSLPELNLKIVPHATGVHSVCQLVAVDNFVEITEVFEGNAALEFFPHVHAPFADFPLKRIHNAYHLSHKLSYRGSRVVKDFIRK